MLRCGVNPIQLSFIAGASPEVIAGCHAHLTKEDAYDTMIRALTQRNWPSEPERPMRPTPTPFAGQGAKRGFGEHGCPRGTPGPATWVTSCNWAALPGVGANQSIGTPPPFHHNSAGKRVTIEDFLAEPPIG